MQSSFFFKLPLEVRLQIYDLLLVSQYLDPYRPEPTGPTGPPILWIGSTSTVIWRGVSGIDLSILSTCTKVASEATFLLYTKHLFHFEHKPRFSLEWLDKIGSTNCHNIRYIHIFNPTNRVDGAEYIDIINRCSGLRRFHINCNNPLSFWKGLACDFLEAASPLLKDHPTLTKTLSEYPNALHAAGCGYECSKRFKCDYNPPFQVTFVAHESDGVISLDGIPFDIDDAIQAIKSHMLLSGDGSKNYPKKNAFLLERGERRVRDFNDTFWGKTQFTHAKTG